MADFDGDKREQSEFNMAVSYLNRLNALFYTADNYAINMDMWGWYHACLALFRELSTEMKEKEISELNNLQIEIGALVNKQLNAQNSGGTSINHELYKALHSFEIKLRKVMKEAGLQLKAQDEASKALR